MSKAKDFFEKLSTDAKAKEMFKDSQKPTNYDDLIQSYIDAAKKLGFDLTKEDILEYFKEKGQGVKASTDSAAEAVKALPDDDLLNVAGGGDHKDCKDTFKDKENCYWNDGCDIVNNSYEDYKCNHNNEGYHCGWQYNAICDESFLPKCSNGYF